MIEPVIGFVPKPAPAVRYVIYYDKRGAYAELNLATLTWCFTSEARHATKFRSAEDAAGILSDVIKDCGDLWHLTREDLRVVEKP